jgi:hypothetical protein
MNFYLLFYQLIENTERLEGEAKYLASHALSTSPRDGHANRSLLEQCGDLLHGVKELLNSKAHISKVQLRRTAILFQILETAHRRVLRLAGASVPQDESSITAIWGLLRQAQGDYWALRTALYERMGVPINLNLPEEDGDFSFLDILQTESVFQEELLNLIEKGIEVFDEESGVAGQLVLVRKGLLEARRNVKRLLARHSPNREPAIPLGRGLGVSQP